MSAPAPPAAGSVVAGRYRVDGVVGAGGMGIVLRATDLEAGTPVALKVLSGDLAEMAETVARFDLEVRAMSKIASQHVVTVLDAGRTGDGMPFLAMELLEGEDLAEVLERRGRLPPEEAVGLIIQACAGVAAAHAVGVLHRDLKPANLFLARRAGQDPILKILDFGLTKFLSSSVRLTLTASTLGTPMYMAPEQIASSKSVDARCDQHALAMILFELLTGRPPYDFDNAGKLVVAIVTHPVPSPRALLPDLPAPLDKTLRRALGKRPEDRFADVGQLARALEPFASPESAAIARLAESTLSASVGGEAETTATIEVPQASPHLSSFEMGPTEQVCIGPNPAVLGVPEPRPRPPPAAERPPRRGEVTRPLAMPPPAARTSRKLLTLFVGISVGVMVMVAAAIAGVGGLRGPSPEGPVAEPSFPRSSAVPTAGVPEPRTTSGASSAAPPPDAAEVPSSPLAASTPSGTADLPPPAESRPVPSAPRPPRPRGRRDPLRQYD